ncbi:MAG: quinone-dependent dihydroorotate dehydrogenase [Bacteroidetes bacterium]|nr:quinone-dependent dihydroorotate dehydrogenase [Bacteroidota bacterium]
MYKAIRQFLFLFSAESVHYFAMKCLKMACKMNWTKNIIVSQFCLNKPGFEKDILGLRFKNIIGLGAGFDKNAVYLNELEALGFGFVEVGTVTPLPQPGNEKPRLFRLPHDKALINRMGFNNDGVQIIASRLRAWKEKNLSSAIGQRLIIGGNIGKNKITANEDAWKDYEICFRELFDCVDYFVVNVSSPNTPGLRALQEKESLRKILSQLQVINRQQERPKPLLLKIAPDLSLSQIDDVISLAEEIGLDGLVCTNTTISRDGLSPLSSPTSKEAGGLSGAPLKEKSTEIVKYIRDHIKTPIPIIGSGGIFNSMDAKEKLDAGANLLQVWTGFIYEGPAITKKILSGL